MLARSRGLALAPVVLARREQPLELVDAIEGDDERLEIVAGGRPMEVVALEVEGDRVERHRRRLEVGLRVQRAADPRPLDQHLIAVGLPHQPGVVLEGVVVVRGSRQPVAVEHAGAVFELVGEQHTLHGDARVAAARVLVGDVRAVDELLVAGRGHLLAAGGHLELAEHHAEAAAPLGIPRDVRVFQKCARVCDRRRCSGAAVAAPAFVLAAGQFNCSS